MEHDHQALDVPAPEIVVDNGEANSAANATGEPPAGNGGDRHLLDADEFKAIGTLCDNLASGGTMDIDIRLRQSGGVAPVVQATAAPGNVIAAAGLPAHVEQQQAAAAAPSTRLKITVAVDDIEPHQPHKADWEYLNSMRGWLMTVATLVVGITFQAMIQPPDWIQHVLASDPSHHNDGAAAAPSPDAANQGGTIDFASTWYGEVSAKAYVFADLLTFVTALAVVALLTHAPKTASARFTKTLVTRATAEGRLRKRSQGIELLLFSPLTYRSGELQPSEAPAPDAPSLPPPQVPLGRLIPHAPTQLALSSSQLTRTLRTMWIEHGERRAAARMYVAIAAKGSPCTHANIPSPRLLPLAAPPSATLASLMAAFAGLPPVMLRAAATATGFTLDINVLMLVAVVSAAALGQFMEAGAMWLETVVCTKATTGMTSLMGMVPAIVMLAEAGTGLSMAMCEGQGGEERETRLVHRTTSLIAMEEG
ncbi:hypothetical protein HU200_040874 [Digitaria exilis]|uniref:Uncharacterized protein n=1 Tax=Digitaria exilis TaxID=1010633 RepID=A0A835EJF8_9POAL|nr:hypothetical protein HU200_040874 [Digitaria exilis]